MPLIGNNVTQAEIRRWLVDRDYGAHSAKFDEVELAAIQRPGWVQIFRFQLTARTPDGRKVPLYGVVRDDGRIGAKFRVSESRGERDRWLAEWSGELGPSHSPDTAPPPRWLVVLLLGGIATLVLAALLNR
jgi:hypothetical protein